MGARDIFTPRIDGKAPANYTRYRATIQVRDKLIGGVPKDPDTIAKWITARLQLGDRALLEMVNETAAQMQADRSEQAREFDAEIAVLGVRIDSRRNEDGEPLDEDALTALKARRERLTEELEAIEPRPDADELVAATARKMEGGNGFKAVRYVRDPDGYWVYTARPQPDAEVALAYEGRCLKAAVKEAVNVGYPGTDFPSKKLIGAPDPATGKITPAKGFRKGLMSTMAERVFVDDLYIPMIVDGQLVVEPTGTEQRIKHVMTPQGPRSAINVVDFVERPTLSAVIRVQDDFLSPAEWLRIMEIAENIGIGADRARSDGKFDLVEFEEL